MLSCKEIVKIISLSPDLEKDVSLVRRAELKLHLMMCKHCSWYSKHLRILAEKFRLLLGAKSHVNPSEVEQLEKKIIEKVTQK